MLATGTVGIDADEARSRGVHGLISKPYLPAELLELLGRLAPDTRAAHGAEAANLLRMLLPHAFDWILPEQLGACVNPSVSESAAAELLTHSIALLVNLHERPDPPELLAHLGAQTVHLPVPDSLAPTQDQLERGVAVIGEALREGKRVVVHCAAGLGRSGTLIAAYLVSQGSAPDESIGLVRAARPGSVENDEQEAAVHQFARRFTSC